VVGARILGLGAGDSAAAEETGDDGKDDDEGDYAAGVDGGDEKGGGEGVPAEHEFAVEKDDGHGAHCYAEHGRVDGRDEGQVPAYGGVGAWAGRPEDGDWGEDVVGFYHLGAPGEPRLGYAFGSSDVLSLFPSGHLAFFVERFGDNEKEEEEE